MHSKTKKEVISSVYNTPIQARLIDSLKGEKPTEAIELLKLSLEELNSLKKRYQQALYILEQSSNYLDKSINECTGECFLVS